MATAGLVEIEATEEAQREWTAHVAEVAEMTLFPRADSYYVGANVPGKPRVMLPYLGGFSAYRDRCDEVAAKDYEGFELRRGG
jgi:cyclohexanone monooxygenase